MAALGIDTVTIVPGYTQYQAYTDITDFVKNTGAGTYEVGNVPLSVGSISDGGNNGGWCIVVVYENKNINYNSIRLYDGFQQVYSDGNPLKTSVTLTGLDVPSGFLLSGDAKMGVLAWEGDANLSEDYLKINAVLFSNATNPANNAWNGTITNNGVHVTTKNPDYTSQMGVDIDQFDVGTGYNILPNSNSVDLEFGTEADKYYPGLFSFTIKMKDPAITLDNFVTDANNNHLGEANEVLTYTLKGGNSGAGNANAIIITDTLPSTVTYLSNSLNVIAAPGVATGIKTDAGGDDVAEYVSNGSVKTIIFRIGAGATSLTGGTLKADENYEVQFKVTVNDPDAGKHVPSIMNIARIKAVSDANVNFVDDGTSIINLDCGPLPVTLVAFTASLLQNDKVKIDWSTSMEINCDKYKIEKSTDGNIFTAIATVAGNNTTSIFHSYSYLDDASAETASLIYYRLVQIDIDGKASYSAIAPVKIKNLFAKINASPNPFNNYLKVNIEWETAEVVSLKIFNVLGKEVLIKNIQMNKGLNYISINELSKLQAGNYIIKFISANQQATQKIIKQ